MRNITEIRKIGKGERYYLYLDDEFFGIYEAEILARYSLKTGQSFDEDFFEKLKNENGDYACFNRSLGVLEKSMKSEKMLKDYLYGKGYPKSCIDRAIEKLKEYGYINDESFAENFIRSYSDVKSKRKIKFDLMSKGISEEIIESKLSQFVEDDDEKALALRLGQKYLNGKELDMKTKQRFYNHMTGKGFDFSLITWTWEEIENGRN